jgi:predicted dinucleotide-binding enzyme
LRSRREGEELIDELGLERLKRNGKKPDGWLERLLPLCIGTNRKERTMRIGIVGTGNIGANLTRKLMRLGHRVSMANSRGPASLAGLAKETGAQAVTVPEAVKNVDIVVVTIPEKNVRDLPRGLFRDVPHEAVVVDTGNYYPSIRDGRIEAIEKGATESGWVSSVLERPVVKAFNSIVASSLAEGGLPKGAKDRIALPVAGDDARAKSVILAMFDELGFDGVDAGPLDESWRQQPGTPVYCTDLNLEGVQRALSKADRAKAPAMREQALAEFQRLSGSPPRDIIVALRRLAGVS